MAKSLKERLAEFGLLLSMISGGTQAVVEPMVRSLGSQSPSHLVTTDIGIKPSGAPGSNPQNPYPPNPSDKLPFDKKLHLVIDGLRKRKKRNRPFLDLDPQSMIARIAVARDGTTILLTPRDYDDVDLAGTLQDSPTFNNHNMRCEYQDGAIALVTKGLPIAPETLVTLLLQAELIQPDDGPDCLSYLKESLKLHAPARG